MMSLAGLDPRVIWLVIAYAVGSVALAIALGKRLKTVRTSHKQLAAMNRRRLGL